MTSIQPVKFGLLIGVLAILMTSPAIAQDVFSSRGGGRGLNTTPAPDEQRDPVGYYAYMLAHGYCPTSTSLHPGWQAHPYDPNRKCDIVRPNSQPGLDAAQTQSVQRRYDKFNNSVGMQMGTFALSALKLVGLQLLSMIGWGVGLLVSGFANILRRAASPQTAATGGLRPSAQRTPSSGARDWSWAAWLYVASRT